MCKTTDEQTLSKWGIKWRTHRRTINEQLVESYVKHLCHHIKVYDFLVLTYYIFLMLYVFMTTYSPKVSTFVATGYKTTDKCRFLSLKATLEQDKIVWNMLKVFILVKSKLHWNFSLFWSNGYIVWSIFPLLLQASTGHLSHGFFHHALGVHELSHIHSLASLQWSWFSDQQTVLPTEKCLQFQKMESLQPAKTAAMSMACHEYTRSPPPPSSCANTKLIYKMNCTNW